MRPASAPIAQRIVTLSNDNTARIWDVAVDLKAPRPSWVVELAGGTEPMVDATQLEIQCAEMPSFPPPRTFTGRGYHPEAITPERKRWHPTNGAHLPAFGLLSAGTREQQVGREYHTSDPSQHFRPVRSDCP